MTDGLDADVLVVGCGPVGVMAALRCAQRGLRVVAVDRSTEIYPLPRALGMDEEVQDVFARAGLLDALRADSAPLPGGEFVDATGARVVGIEMPDGHVGPLGHPPVVTFDQPGLEAALRSAAVEAGVDMRLGLDAFAVDDLDPGTGEGVRVDLTDDTGDVTVTARWLIAADGAKSTVRSLRGLTMVDQGFDQTWLVVDTTLLDPDLPLPRLARQVCDPDRVCTLVPGPRAHRRWEFQLKDDEDRDQMLADTTIADLLEPWGTADQLQIDRAAVYRFHATVAERFRDGPVFLAGDAAHQMPPFNGQGMCTGIRDAENLAWKMAHVADGLAAAAVLDTYDEERRPHAAGQVAHSVDAGLLMQAIAHDGEAALDSGYGQRPFPKLQGGGFVPGHDAVGTVVPNPCGPRGPVVDDWTVLMSHGQPGPAALSAIGATVEHASVVEYPRLIDDAHAVVVRPDRYVAAVTDDVDAALAAMATWATTGGTP